jgi:outer membrane protein assembly factor BamD (BamD/ComL family)
MPPAMRSNFRLETLCTTLALLGGAGLNVSSAFAQLRIVDDEGGTSGTSLDGSQARMQTPTRELTIDERVMQDARKAIASRSPGKAKSMLDAWIEKQIGSEHPQLPEAYYLRGNAKLAADDEYDALFDYEEVVRNFSGSEFFVSALEKELEVAKLYFNGRLKPSLGLRIDSGVPTAEEIVIRIGERLPGSKLAEKAMLELADYYARSRDLRLAAETYDVFVRLFPRSAMRPKAMQRRIYANVAQFKGPEYDASVLRDAAVQIQEFQEEFPAQAQETGLTDALAARLDESQAAGMLTTARWYVRQDDLVSAKVTLTRLIRKHPRTAAAHEGLELLDTVRASLGIAQPAKLDAKATPVDVSESPPSSSSEPATP